MDPKRNYQGGRIIIFYIKTFINSIKKHLLFKNLGADILYKNRKKEIQFFPNKVKTFFYEYKTKKRYHILINNGVLQDVSYKEGYFEFPFYRMSDPIILKNENSLDLVKDTLLLLITIRVFVSNLYISKIKSEIDKLNIEEKDLSVLKNILSIESIPVYLSFVHGDLWSGNILKTDKGATIIDWDDLTFKSFTYDLFYYQFQLYGANLNQFYENYEKVKFDLLPTILYLSRKANIPFREKDYDIYYRLFIIERMIKRYD